MALHPCPGTLNRRARNTPGPRATTGVLNEQRYATVVEGFVGHGFKDKGR
ncbi:hypothetical protein G5B35_02035 [Parapusillimonas sp. SGNA-6]|nr:hypothetical protein [Parapusillimonas sp. SGNA-6]